jgi:hypothetical protein
MRAAAEAAIVSDDVTWIAWQRSARAESRVGRSWQDAIDRLSIDFSATS